MRTIYSPSNDGTDRWDECAAALEPAFMQLVDRAQHAGWCSDEIVGALDLLARLAAEHARVEANQNQPGHALRLSHARPGAA